MGEDLSANLKFTSLTVMSLVRAQLEQVSLENVPPRGVRWVMLKLLKIRGMGLHGVVICLAHRKSEEFNSLILHLINHSI